MIVFQFFYSVQLLEQFNDHQYIKSNTVQVHSVASIKHSRAVGAVKIFLDILANPDNSLKSTK